MKKILHLSTVHPIDDPRVFQKEVRSLRSTGRDVVVAALRCANMPADVAPAHVFDRAPSRARRLAGSIPRVISTVKQERPALLHFHDPEILAALPFVRSYCERIVYDSHEHISEQTANKPYIPEALRPIASRGVGFVEAALVRYVDAVVTPTPHIESYFRSLGKIAVTVANYPDRAALPDFADPAGRSPQAVYTGVMSGTRGLDEMLAAAAATGAELELAGNVEAGRRPLLEQATRNSNVRYHGTIPRAECLAMQSRAMVGFQLQMPVQQYMTAIPTKVFEYFAMGLIVICSGLPFLRELFAGFPTIHFVDPRNVAEIEAAWRAALAEYPARTDDLLFSRKKVLEEFTWESQAAKLVGLYEQLGC